MVDRFLDRLAHQIDLQLPPPQALDVVGAGSDRILGPGGRTGCDEFLVHHDTSNEAGPRCDRIGARVTHLLQPFLTSGQTLSLSGRNA
jgi:hypothetical protein